MWMLIRQLSAVALLPGVVTIAVPVWIAGRNHVALTMPHDAWSALMQAIGILVSGVGLVLFCASLYYFWSRGRGTLAPWDPPRRFVVEGPYRFVRNPMISGVIFVLIGEALVLRSRALGEWAATFIAINAVYIPILEEPALASRFGEPYRRYTRSVGRFIPRLRGWTPDRNDR
jgi:protein-S-isoprenylcysteine O-methyltransferase Ste14